MAMLAEKRVKTKWTINPQGSLWSKDDSKRGQQMLEKMGWSKGKGLGKAEDGRLEPVKVAFKCNSQGLGYTGIKDDGWTAHTEEYEQLLARLQRSNGDENDNSQAPTITTLKSKPRVIKTRISHRRFQRGKDLSRYSEKDLKSIFGTKENNVEANFYTSYKFDTNEAGNDMNDIENEPSKPTELENTTAENDENLEVSCAKKRKKDKHEPEPGDVEENEEKFTLLFKAMATSFQEMLQKSLRKKKKLQDEEALDEETANDNVRMDDDNQCANDGVADVANDNENNQACNETSETHSRKRKKSKRKQVLENVAIGNNCDEATHEESMATEICEENQTANVDDDDEKDQPMRVEEERTVVLPSILKTLKSKSSTVKKVHFDPSIPVPKDEEHTFLEMCELWKFSVRDHKPWGSRKPVDANKLVHKIIHTANHKVLRTSNIFSFPGYFA